MPAPVLHIVRSAAFARRAKNGQLLSLEEARARAETPPSEVVEWTVTERASGRTVSAWAQLWSEARALGAATLGVNTDAVTCVRATSTAGLPGNGAA